MQPPASSSLGSTLALVASAALVALAIHLSLREPWIGLVVGVLALLVALPQLRARRRMRRLLTSGDVEAVLAMWEVALDRVPHKETLLPLIRATALAANGMTERARDALARAAQGPAWDATLEQRLFVETLLDTFEGERDVALGKAGRLANLPLPPAGPLLRLRVSQARRAIGAFARAFAHRADRGDLDVLLAAARKNPLIHWPLRYAAAIVCIDSGQPARARRLIHDAPSWPEDSAFHAFHSELLTQAAEG